MKPKMKLKQRFTAFFAIFMLVVATSSAAVDESLGADPKGLHGVDPNDLVCDVLGQALTQRLHHAIGRTLVEVHLLLPHFTDCNKFYTCDNGEEVERTCPLPLIFDFILQVCNWDWATTCTLRKPDDSKIDGSGDGSGEYSEVTDEWAAEEVGFRSGGDPEIMKDPEAPVEAIRIDGSAHFRVQLDCKNLGSAEKRIANKDDCQRYWRCVDGEINSFYCTDGLFFNEKTQQCDFEANAACNVNHEHELQEEFIVYKS